MAVVGETEGTCLQPIGEQIKHDLNKDEVKAVMARRDKVVEQFQKLIAEKGEKGSTLLIRLLRRCGRGGDGGLNSKAV